MNSYNIGGNKSPAGDLVRDRQSRYIILSASAMLILGVLLAMWTTFRISNLEQGHGSIIQVSSYSGRGKGFPCIVDFADAAGKHYTFTTRTQPGRVQIGEAVDVLFDPADPSGTAEIESWMRQWVLSIGFAFIGLMFFGLRVVWLRTGRV